MNPDRDARQNSSELNFAPTPATIDGMLEMLIVVVRALTLALRGHRELVLENLALRQQLAAFHRTRRCRLRARDRLFGIALARSWHDWRTALIVVQPGTVIRWHRDWLRRRWTRRSQQRHHGRPTIDQRVRTLVREMATANPLWGAPRIHGELRMLGVAVSERTVSRLLESRTRPPSQTWRTFLTNHLTSAASMDFFTVPTLTFVGASCTSTSRIIQQRSGPPNKSSTHSRTTPRPGGCTAIAIVRTARRSGAEWRAWASPKWSQRRRVRGRIRTRNA